MQQTVFRYKRAKGKTSTQWVGRYRFDDMPRYVEVPLHTADEMVARKRLQDLVTRLQRESEGLAASAPMRAAMHSTFADLVGEYALDLHAQRRDKDHVKDTTRRVLRVAKEAGWKRLGDANASTFTKWRGGVKGLSAKTLKEYQVSVSAFFSWLVETERYDRNPVAKVRKPQTRGQATRTRRAFTPEEARRLLAVADYHRVPYLVLLYTGLRYEEARGLRWCDFTNEGGTWYFTISGDKTKNRETARIPVRPELVAEVETLRDKRAEWNPQRRIFAHLFPGQKTTAAKPNALRRDLAKAGVPVLDARGHVLDYHSFRKTWNTWAATAGVPQRAAQAILRHSTPDLTAGAYTDVLGLGLATEVSRLNWIGGPETGQKNGTSESVPVDVLAENRLAQTLIAQLLKMVDPTGLESGKSFILRVLEKSNALLGAHINTLKRTSLVRGASVPRVE